MAINMQDKRGLLNQILGEADITVTTSGLTISGPRLSSPRFVPFDESGRCKSCKGTEVEVDIMVTKEGITIWCTRIARVQFVPFDIIYDLPGHCFFRVKNKARVFNIPYGDLPAVTYPNQEAQAEQQQLLQQQQNDLRQKANMAFDLVESGLLADSLREEEVQRAELKRKAKVALDLIDAGLAGDALREEGQRWKKAKTALSVLGNMLLADSLTPLAEKKTEELPLPPAEKIESLPLPPLEKMKTPPLPPVDKPLPPSKMESDEQQFYDSISAATTMMDTSMQQAPLKRKQPTPKGKTNGMKKSTEEVQNQGDIDKTLDEFFESVNAATNNLSI